TGTLVPSIEHRSRRSMKGPTMNRTSAPREPGDATTGDARWAAIMARDAGADGTFFYAVRTTGVYCRPSCGARPPRPENVEFHATAASAEQAGFRPCK